MLNWLTSVPGSAARRAKPHSDGRDRQPIPKGCPHNCPPTWSAEAVDSRTVPHLALGIQWAIRFRPTRKTTRLAHGCLSPRNQTPCFPDRERRSATASADARGLPAPWPRLVGAASVTSAGGLENSWPKSSFVLLLFSFTKAPNDSIRDDLVGMISPAARQAGCARNGWRDAGPRMSDGLGRDSPRVRKASVLSALTT